jgi:hypothetical protein
MLQVHTSTVPAVNPAPPPATQPGGRPMDGDGNDNSDAGIHATV